MKSLRWKSNEKDGLSRGKAFPPRSEETGLPRAKAQQNVNLNILGNIAIAILISSTVFLLSAFGNTLGSSDGEELYNQSESLQKTDECQYCCEINEPPIGRRIVFTFLAIILGIPLFVFWACDLCIDDEISHKVIGWSFTVIILFLIGLGMFLIVMTNFRWTWCWPL